MKQIMHTIIPIKFNRWGAVGLILVMTGWLVGLNPASALAELSSDSFEPGVFMSVSPIETPTDTPPPTDMPAPTDTPTDTPPPADTPPPTDTPSATDTPQPNPDTITLVFEGPGAVSPGETFAVSVKAQGVGEPGLYGVQFEIDFDPTLFSVGDLQVNPDLSVVVINNADNSSGKIRLAAARQGAAPGLTGDVPLLTFTVTVADTPGSGTFTITGQKIGSPEAVSLNTIALAYPVSIQDSATPEPTPIPSDTPSPEPTPIPSDTPTPIPSETPAPTETPIPGPTETPIPTETPGPTETPAPGPTETVTPEPTGVPTTATVLGQIILTGRANNDWSGASALVDDNGPSATTDALGHFNLLNVTAGAHTAITADAPGYLPAVCTAPIITAPETTLSNIALLSGDVNDDGQVNITDGTTIGVFFGNTGPDLPADINRDQQVDILDLILVTINFGQGPQVWICVE